MQRLERWQPLLREAATERDVVRIVREYVDLWSAEERAGLPVGVNPWNATTRQGIAECAVDLARAELVFAGDEETRRRLADMKTIFRDAVTRFGQISQEARLLGPQSEG
ncbi:MAG TPA: hypothetical protein VFE23_15130 [Usitatibacter sp.]|jgi:hypothetical protein|nr:hypothetical protein [Usitatibacter sp.]